MQGIGAGRGSGAWPARSDLAEHTRGNILARRDSNRVLTTTDAP